MANRVQKALGFARPGDLWLWFFFSGALALFSAISLRFLYFETVFCARGGSLPGECFYFRSGLARFGMIAHLWCVLPASILASIQFVPVLRRPRLIRLHRTIGYASLILAVAGALVALPNIRHAFGGDLASQTTTGLLMVVFVVAQLISYVSIKRGDVRGHRHWMLRSWSYAGSVITQRLIMVPAAIIISRSGGYYLAMPCDKINFMLGSPEETMRWYPGCIPYLNGSDASHRVVVDANIFGTNRAQFAAAFNLTYGMGGWLALMSHAIGAEAYIQYIKSSVTRPRIDKSK